MKHMALLFIVLSLSLGYAGAAELSITGTEPDVSELGALLYPGSVFIRVISSLDPFYESVMYVSPDPVGDVKNFFGKELPSARVVQFKDEYEWVWTYLLKDWILFPDKPTRDDFQLLDVSPNVLCKKFQKNLHEPLIEYFGSKPEYTKQLVALKSAKTIIRYTFRKIEEDIGFTKIEGIWKNTDRDLPEYYGCNFSFSADSTYTITLKESNIVGLAEKLSGTGKFKDMSRTEIESMLRKKNPEKGRFAIMRNTIDMITDEPVFGDKLKSGLADVNSFSVVIQLINMPRLTFIRRRN